MRDISGSQSYYYHYGPQGETRHLTNGSATVTDSYRYTAYGQTLYTSGSTENYHKYGGKYGYYTQGALGTILAGARVYYPNARRWVQKDPILFDGGVNVFEYVRGNPVRYVDPDGKVPALAWPIAEEAGKYIAPFFGGGAAWLICQSYPAVCNPDAGKVNEFFDDASAGFEGFCDANGVNIFSSSFADAKTEPECSEARAACEVECSEIPGGTSDRMECMEKCRSDWHDCRKRVKIGTVR